MAGIQPISGISGQIRPITTPAQPQAKDAKASGFGKVMNDMLTNVNESQQASQQAIGDLVAGKTDDVLPVVKAVADADLSFKLLIGVRNKVIEAYKQTMNMQI